MKSSNLSRREFTVAAAALGTSLGSVQWAPAADKPQPVSGKADACIFLWLGGGACHIDTWDPKRKGDGKKTAGSYYDAIDTAIPGVRICQHLQKTAGVLDRCVLVRSAHHDVIDEHAAATNRVHTGRPPTGTTAYPSIGSLIAHEKGAAGDGVPAYVLAGYPSSSRGPGYLGAKYSYIYLTDTEAGPSGLRRPEGVSTVRQARRDALLAKTRAEYQARHSADYRIGQYGAAAEAALTLAGPKFMSVFDLKNESESLRASYGGEFGQRCLLARRLVESGVRFVEVSFNLNFINGTGWDTHNEGQQNQHLLIQQLDEALAALLTDLEKRGRLDRTLVVVATEFGRPPEFDGGGGRGHHSQAFSMVLAGGGLKTGKVIGATDELGKKVVDRPVSIPDFHATIHASLGIDYAKELYDGERPIPITDQGTPLRELFT
ncbi:MAG: DUF1501 domain-containing protein [Planctomycetales bacterium]|nr:DUF1501 domain-containing protein [Planctomycetales bacterium]